MGESELSELFDIKLVSIMSSPAEKAAARRAKVLARAKKGNSVTASMDDDDGLAAAATIAKTNTDDSSKDGNDNDNTTPTKINEDSTMLMTPDSILDSTDVGSATSSITNTTPATDDTAARKERPLEARRRLINERKARARAELAPQMIMDETTKDDDTCAKVEEDVNNETSPKIQFVSRSAREVEIEIASINRGNPNADFLGAEGNKGDDDSAIYEYSKPTEDAATGGSTDDQDTTDAPRVKIMTLREKQLLKKAQRRAAGSNSATTAAAPTEGDMTASTNGDNGTQTATKGDAYEKESLKQQRLHELAVAKAADPQSIPRIIRILLLITLAVMAGITSYQNNQADSIKLLHRRERIIRDNVENGGMHGSRTSNINHIKKKLAKSSKSSSSSVDNEVNSVMDNNDINLDALFEEEAAQTFDLLDNTHVGAGEPSQHMNVIEMTYHWVFDHIYTVHHMVTEHSTVGPKYTQLCNAFTSFQSTSGTANSPIITTSIIDNVYKTTFHKDTSHNNIDSNQANYSLILNDIDYTVQGCSTHWHDTGMIAVFIAWILSTMTINIIKSNNIYTKGNGIFKSLIPHHSPNEKTGWLASIWNWFTGDFDLLDYIKELCFGFIGEFSLYYTITIIVACAMASKDAAIAVHNT